MLMCSVVGVYSGLSDVDVLGCRCLFRDQMLMCWVVCVYSGIRC